ncbi:MAG: hypothetical protein CVT72_06920 [Alphaproteobacteria bacterium HGW-Alphaproteobacteria-11]|nr:MAG: hypothetical protein CVT72_06920 [Alphaproteobacteria bacterium HGW-Alphaproteobacteria-11]
MVPEFSLKLAVKDVPPAGKSIEFNADAETCAALARRFGILELQGLKGTVTVRPFRKQGLIADCRFEATVVQACVVTLDPVTQRIEESFTRRWLPEQPIEPGTAIEAREVLIEAEGEDAPEPMTGGAVDIGEAVAEELALAIEPYPRKAGVAYDLPSEAPEDAAEERPNPFTVLEKLKKND